jgi:hypothetical protein
MVIRGPSTLRSSGKVVKAQRTTLPPAWRTASPLSRLRAGLFLRVIHAAEQHFPAGIGMEIV